MALAAVAGGVVVHGVALLVFRVPVPLPPVGDEPRPFVQLARTGEGAEAAALAAEALLFDSAPLFLPSPLNAGGTFDDVARLEDKANLFDRFEAAVRLDSVGLEHLPGAALTGSPGETDWLAGEPLIQPLARFGETRRVEAPLLGGPVVLVEGLDGSPLRMRFTIPREFADNLPQGMWQSARFLVHTSAYGSLGLPLLERSSTVVALDEMLRAYLASDAFLSALPTGYFRVTIHP
ncbi:MAG: hypothetical protein JJT96_20305 [Opitutales bacterium]|nr:hypothetical protein [Opitutales bacterium]